MKHFLFLLLALIAPMSPLLAHAEQTKEAKNITYRFRKSESGTPIALTLTTGSWLHIKGDQKWETVGESEMSDVGCRQFDGTHFIKYQYNLGGKEGVKITYNASLWHFDEDAYNDSLGEKKDAALKILKKEIHNIRGAWKFHAVHSTPPDEPQALQFVNEDGVVATIEVTVCDAGSGEQ